MSANSRRTHTVKDVARMSGVSVRTLRFYDEIGLLKPAFYGDNGYRYYEKEQLLKLQQVLFYRELGIELAQVKKILDDPDFDTAAALRLHRDHLKKETERTQALIRTIDKTLAHLEEEAPMKDDEIYLGFDPKKQAEYERELVDSYGSHAQKNIEESVRRTRAWRAEDYTRTRDDYDELHRAFTEALDRGLKPADSEVQLLVRQHYEIVDRFWTPNHEAYIGLSQMYNEHSAFKKLYEGYHPRLAEYLAEAMKVFAEKELS